MEYYPKDLDGCYVPRIHNQKTLTTEGFEIAGNDVFGHRTQVEEGIAKL